MEDSAGVLDTYEDREVQSLAGLPWYGCGSEVRGGVGVMGLRREERYPQPSCEVHEKCVRSKKALLFCSLLSYKDRARSYAVLDLICHLVDLKQRHWGSRSSILTRGLDLWIDGISRALRCPAQATSGTAVAIQHARKSSKETFTWVCHAKNQSVLNPRTSTLASRRDR